MPLHRRIGLTFWALNLVLAIAMLAFAFRGQIAL